MKIGSDFVLPLLLLGSAGLNLLQMQQLRAARTANLLQRGQAVPPLTVSTLDDKRVRMQLAGDLPVVLYVFTPECGWCKRNHEQVARLEKELRGRFRFIGISLSDGALTNYLADHPLPFPVYKNPSGETVLGYRMGDTPQTIVVSAQGTIERSWNGAYEAGTLKDIEAFFAVRLAADGH